MTEVVLVTGGSRGIGAAVCRRLAKDGRAVVVNYAANRGAADALVAEITSTGGTARAVQGDVQNEADVLQMFDVADSLGTLVGLVNNAGVVDQSQRLDEMSLERLTRMFSINVIGSFLCAREAVRRMSTRHGGKGGGIVNLGSAASKLGSPGQYVDYAAA
ncbi:MAG: SDR family NAD(P)-dependent oxidoreductase, partial [Roseibium sp.]